MLLVPTPDEAAVKVPDSSARIDVFPGDSEMARRMREFDWSATPLGPAESWPRSLQTVIFLMLNSRYPMFVWWGSKLINLYNDAYIPVLGARHPEALGRSAPRIWNEIWDVLGPQAEAVMREGRATWNESLLLVMERYGFTEETYFTFSYSPAPDNFGNVGGVFCACTEDTKRVIGERRLRTLRRLGEQATQAKSVAEACAIAAATMRDNPYDLPFAMIYFLDENGAKARRLGATIPENRAAPRVIELGDEVDMAWSCRQVIESAQSLIVSDLGERFATNLPGGAWPEPAREAVVLPLINPAQARPSGILIAGVSPRLLLDEDYRAFLNLAAGHIAAAVGSARAYEQERKRVEALAEIDRAKTLFFSNVSHEFRTPLTLILGPVEELLSGAVGDTNEVQRAHLMTLRNNAVRLQKLVNTLLDFARVEAGRIEAVYEPVDIGILTRELASTFCSAVHRAGLLYIMNCPSIDAPVYIDRDMWEKIVLNLLSNALKFTFRGVIEISVTEGDEARGASGEWRVANDAVGAFHSVSSLDTRHSPPTHVVLTIRDTGVGIPEHELPHVFDRFHRIPNNRSRTQEGSGIGLALVQELVRLHGGSIQVESEIDRGTTFTICIPTGSAHLPESRLSATRTLASTALGAAPFVEEALSWLPRSDQDLLPISSLTLIDGSRPPVLGSERILIADDNLGMRDYLARLLQTHWAVTAVEDGMKALDIAQNEQPDLILSDVMMPGLDGFALLRKLRENDQTSAIPVILLSARAGEEAYIEGMNAGADDYIAKPFSARELIARIKALLDVTRVRRESERRVTNILESITDGFQVIDADWRLTYINLEAKRTLEEHGIDPEWAIGKHFWNELFPDGVESDLAEQLRHAMTVRVPVAAESYYAPWQRWYGNRIYPLPEGGLANYFQDITARKRAELSLAESLRQQKLLYEFLGRLYLAESLDELYGAALDAILSGLRCARAAILLLDPSNVMRFVAWRGLSEPYRRAVEGHSPWSPDEMNPQPVCIPDISSAEVADSLKDVVMAEGIGALAFIPLVLNGKLIGKFMTYYDGPHSFSNEEIDLGHTIARQLALGIEHEQAEIALRDNQERLRQSELRFRTMADSSPILIWMTDPAGKALFLNRSYRVYFAITSEDPERFDWLEVVHPDDRAGYAGAFATALKGEAMFQQRVRVRKYDGSWHWLESCGDLIFDEAGNRIGFIGSSVDITEIYESQQALKDLDRRKDEFLATLSHELRNPLAPIRNAVEILKTLKPAPPLLEWSRNLIDQQVSYMARLMEDLLDLSRITRGALELRKQRCDLRAIIQDAVETSRPLIGAGSHTLTLDLPEENLALVADPTRLTQLFANLLNNAAKYTEPNGQIQLSARVESTVAPSAIATGGVRFDSDQSKIENLNSTREVVVSVKDTGIGIEPEMLPRLFDMFVQADSGRERRYGGLGIGLTLARSIVELHGGTICAASEGIAKGSEFTVRLPLAKDLIEDGADLAASASRAGRESKPPSRRVMVVDDNKNQVESIAMLLRLQGFEVRTANDALSALEIIEQFVPEFAFIDIGLPGIDGFELARRIRATSRLKDVVLIAQTGWGREEDRAQSRRAGFDYHLTKPIDFRLFENILVTNTPARNP